MRITYKALQQYFREYVAPIAPLLRLSTIYDGYCIELWDNTGEFRKNLLSNVTTKEVYDWMKGFVNSYNYFNVGGYRRLVNLYQEVHEPDYISAMAEDKDRTMYDEVMDTANAIQEGVWSI